MNAKVTPVSNNSAAAPNSGRQLADSVDGRTPGEVRTDEQARAAALADVARNVTADSQNAAAEYCRESVAPFGGE